MHKVFLAVAISLAAMTLHPNAEADEYSHARAELVEAYQQNDFSAMRRAAQKSLTARPGYPGALFNLALAEALDDDAAASLLTLRDLLSVGVDFGVADMPEFAALKDLLEWGDYAAAVERLHEPIGFAELVADMDVPNFIPEGIAIDDKGRFYLGSIRHGQLARVGDESEVLSTPKNGHWSVFGMRFDRQGSLWFASAHVAEFRGTDGEPGRSGLFRLDIETGEITDRALLPTPGAQQVLGDLVIAPDGVIYTTDSVTGILYAYDDGEFRAVVDQGVFGSPQGLVLDDAGEHLYVADYIGGLFRVSLTDGAVGKVDIAANVTDYGIDGLYRYGDALVAIQNGVRPHRVVLLELSRDGTEVIAGRIVAANLPEFDEPTLGTVAGDDFFFVANSHWNRFDAENKLPDGLTGPMILRVPLRGLSSR